jgi:hypothetical protein
MADGPEVPLYLKDLGSNYWFEYVPGAKLVFFQYNAVQEGKEPLRLFLDRLFGFMDEHDVERLVIDFALEYRRNAAVEPDADSSPDSQRQD